MNTITSAPRGGPVVPSGERHNPPGLRRSHDHPEVWKVIDRITRRARDQNITIAANTGYDYHTPERILARVQQLYDHEVRAVMIHGAEFLLETYSRRLIDDIRSEVK